MSVGDVVKVRGMRGTWVVHTIYANGDVRLWGGTDWHKSYRAFPADRITAVQA